MNNTSKKSAKALASLAVTLGLCVSMPSLVQAESHVSAGASISFNPSIVSKVVPGIAVGAEAAFKAGVGNMAGTSAKGKAVVTNNSSDKTLPNQASLQAKAAAKQAENSGLLSQEEKASLYLIRDMGHGESAIYNGLGDMVYGPVKKLGALTAQQGEKTVVFATERLGNGEYKLTNLATKAEFVVKATDLKSDYDRILAFHGENKIDLYDLEGHKLTTMPMAAYTPIDSQRFAAQYDKKLKAYVLIDKKTGERVGQETYSYLIGNGDEPPMGVKDYGDYHYEIIHLNEDGLSPREILYSKVNMDAVPKTVGLAEHKVDSVIAPYSEGVAIVASGDKYYGVDKEGDIAFELPKKEYKTIGAFHNGLARVERKVDSFNIGGFLRTILSVSTGSFFTDDYAWAHGKTKYGYINKEGKEIIDAKSKFVSPVIGKYIYVFNDGKFGLYQNDGKVLIPMEYPGLFLFASNDDKDYFIYQAPKTKDYGVMTPQGQVLVQAVYPEAQRYDANIVLFRNKDKQIFAYNTAAEHLSGPFLKADFIEGFEKDFGESSLTSRPLMPVWATADTVSVVDSRTGKIIATLSGSYPYKKWSVTAHARYFVLQNGKVRKAFTYDGQGIY